MEIHAPITLDMKLLHLWEEYQKNPNNENSKLLCRKINEFARKVLSRFRINNPTVSYEDFLQQAYVVFYETVGLYDSNRGTLEGFFMLLYRRHIIKILKGLPYTVPYKDREDNSPNPLEILIANEFDTEIESLLSESESYVYNTYLKEGVFDCKEIAAEEKEDVNIVKWVIDAIGNKIRKYLDRTYNFYNEGAYD